MVESKIVPSSAQLSEGFPYGLACTCAQLAMCVHSTASHVCVYIDIPVCIALLQLPCIVCSLLASFCGEAENL